MKRLGLFLVCLFLLTSHPITLASYSANISLVRPVEIKREIDPKELLCLSLNVYFEAAVESLAGKMAVAQVTLNRVKSSRYPNTICGVVYQGKVDRKGRPILHRCAFSWHCDGKPDIPYKGEKWELSKMVAEYIIRNDNVLLDITDGSTHYHAIYVSPYWKDHYQMKVRIGRHIFYK